jgi:hypothetical protein
MVKPKFETVNNWRLLEAMSALGQKRTFRQVSAMSALPPKADIIHRRLPNVRFVPIANMRHSCDHLAALRGRRRHDANGVVISLVLCRPIVSGRSVVRSVTWWRKSQTALEDAHG